MQWGRTDNSQCPDCNRLNEDAAHLMECPSSHRRALLEEQICKLETWMASHSTEPELARPLTLATLKNIITPTYALQANIPMLGPLQVGIINANGGISCLSRNIHVSRTDLPPETGQKIIVPGVWHSLLGGTNFADQGLIMIFYPHYGGVTIHKPEDVDVSYTGKPGCRVGLSRKHWELFLAYTQYCPNRQQTKRYAIDNKLLLVEYLILSKLPKVTALHLSKVTEFAHSVYELASIGEGIRWMHAACGYFAKLTWIKAIREDNYVSDHFCQSKMCIRTTLRQAK